jgi:AcrR family transcriptional regulator
MRDHSNAPSTPGRPREFDPDDTLTKIMELFWENGFDATGLSDIIKTTGLGKASLYRAFGNKQAMYQKSLARHEQLIVNGAVKTLREHTLTPHQRLSAFLNFPIDAVEKSNDRRGCFLCNASADRAALDKDTSVIVQRGYEKMRAAILETLTEHTPDRAPADTRVQANLVLTVYSGLRVMARSGMDVSNLKDARDACLATL